MEREQEIKKEALFNCNDIAGEADYKSTAAYEGFIQGAEWADEHPINDVYRDLNGDIISIEDLKRRYNQDIEHRKKMVERAVNWLVHNMASGEYIGLHDIIIKSDFIEKFRKAMK